MVTRTAGSLSDFLNTGQAANYGICTLKETNDKVHDPTCGHCIRRVARMMKKTQIHFTKQQIARLDELRRQTGATRTELVRRAVDYYIRGIREHGVQKALLPLPTDDTREAHLE